jgi:hypothetical protein
MEDSGKTAGAALGLGVNVTVYFVDAGSFFPGKLFYTTYVIGPIAMTFSEDPCTGRVIGVTISPLGKGLGWLIHSQGYSVGLQGAVQ